MTDPRPYREVDPRTVDADEFYSVLVGPNDFVCVLTEPEDRTWCRDLSPVMDQLNKLHKENELLRDALRAAREESDE